MPDILKALAEAERLSKAATPGPWTSDDAAVPFSARQKSPFDECGASISSRPDDYDVVQGGSQDEQGGAVGFLKNEDAALTVHLRNNCDSLCSALRSFMESDAALRDIVYRAVHGDCTWRGSLMVEAEHVLEASPANPLTQRVAELETQLSAWHSQFGTTQLSHATAEVEKLRAECKALHAVHEVDCKENSRLAGVLSAIAARGCRSPFNPSLEAVPCAEYLPHDEWCPACLAAEEVGKTKGGDRN